MMNNVGVNSDKICSGCGLCESICPVNAIKVVETRGFLRPEVNERCTACGKCVSSCPGKIETKPVSFKMFQHIYYGHSNNEILRKEAASGAVTTALLKYILASDIVDYVITAAVYQNDRNLGFVIIGKHNIEDLDRYSGSNYCPTNIGRAIRKIKEMKGRYAVVCLPCLARGIDSARKADKLLDSRIKYVITLLCNHVPSYEATDYLIKKYKISVPKMVKYRGDGWFGYFRAYNTSENGSVYFSVPYSEYYATKYSECFWQSACISCEDHFGIYADACMGDADFVKYRNNMENNGETIIFSNNPELVDIIHGMVKKEILTICSDVSSEELDRIYEPLSDANRADERNLRNGVESILREEYTNIIVGVVRRKCSAIKRRLYKIKELWT